MTVGLFVTCLNDTFLPRVGEAVVRVLRYFGCKVEFPAAQTCCGQPAYNGGFRDEAVAVARRMVRIFEPYEHVVTPSASCATMIRHYPELFARDARRRPAADRLAAKTREFTQFLQEVLLVRLEDHLRFEGPVTFHYPCHARALYGPQDWASLMTRCAGASLRPPRHVDLCCGFGGTFSVEFAPVSGAMLDDRLMELSATGAPTVVCNEGGCTLQLAGGAHRRGAPLRFKHVAECLAEGMGLMEPGNGATALDAKRGRGKA